MGRKQKLVNRFNSDNIFKLDDVDDRRRCFEIKQGVYVEMDDPAYNQLVSGYVNEVICDKAGIPVYVRVEGQDESGRNKIDYFPIQEISYYENENEFPDPYESYLTQAEKDKFMEADGYVRTDIWGGIVWYHPETKEYATYDEDYGPLPDGMTIEEAFGE